MKTKVVVGAMGIVLIGLLSAVLVRKCTSASKLCCAPNGEHAKCGECGQERC